MRNVLLVIHVFCAMLWLGGGLASLLSRQRMLAMGGAAARSWMKNDEALGKVFFPAAAVITGLSGIGLVLNSPVYGFGSVFVIIGIAAWVYSAVGNSAFVVKKDRLALAAYEAGDDAKGAALAGLGTRFHYSDGAVIFVALAAMVYRLGA